MLCILCVTTSDQIINIFDEDGLHLYVKDIITKHFWLQPNVDDEGAKFICESCWTSLESFHKFYLKVEAAHTKVHIKVAIKDDDVRSETDDFAYQDYLSSDIKFENYAITKVYPPEFEDESKEVNEPIVDSSSDFESEIPLAQLDKRIMKSENLEKIEFIPISCGEVKKEEKHDNKKSDSKAKRKIITKLDDIGFGNAVYTPDISRMQFDDIIKENMKLSCTICSLPLATFFILKDHYRTVHNETGYVTCCNKKFDSRYKLVTHILLHKNPEHFKCSICGKVMATRKSLNGHMDVHASDGLPLYGCAKCQKTFATVERMERHMNIHQKKEQICELCGQVCRDKYSLRTHQEWKHNSKPRPRVHCEQCGLDFATKTNMTFHKKHHHPETKVTHKCSICGKISTTGYGLKRHMMYMHAFDRRHKCTMCEKGFKTPQGLRVSRSSLVFCSIY